MPLITNEQLLIIAKVGLAVFIFYLTIVSAWAGFGAISLIFMGMPNA